MFEAFKHIRNLPRGKDIGSIREYLLDGVIGIFLVLGFFAVLMGGYEVWAQGRWHIGFVYLAAYMPVSFCFFLRNRITYAKKVWIILMALFGLSVWILSDIGLSGAGLHLLITFIVLTTTFMGIRPGLVSLFLSITAILAVGFGMSRGWIAIDMAVMANSVRMEAWLMAATLFLVIGGIMVLLPGILQNSLQATVNIIQGKTLALKASNQKLTQALADRKEMESKLLKAEKFEAMGLLAGGVAHDLNNILTGVTTYPELLLATLPEDSDLHEPLATIKASGDKAAAIVRDLLTLSGRGVNVKKSTDLNQIIQSYMESPEYEKLAQFHPDVTLTTLLDTTLNPIAGSGVHLSNTVMNLVSNAAEAMSEGGKLTITTRDINLANGFKGYEYIPHGHYSTVEVSDQGSGICDNDLERIFEPFFTKKTMGRSGTGLGMAIVYGAVKDHRGFININTSNRGSVFTLYFPVTDMLPESAPLSLDPEQAGGSGQTILFVDDVAGQRDVGNKLLTSLGYTPHCRASGEAALAWCQTNEPDLLIVDIIMDPGIDGYETLKRIRAIYPHLPAIVFSGYSETSQVESALDLGNVSFLKKPYAIEEFAITVKTRIDNSKK